MKRQVKRITSGMLVASLLMGTFYIPTIAKTTEKSEYSEYVVLVDDKKEKVVNEFIEDEEIYEETLDIDNSFAITVKATKKQIDEISNEEDIIVSENITLNATAKETWTYKPQNMNNNDNETEWNIKMINAESEETEESKEKIKIAILDSGIDYTDEIDVKERINLVPGEEDVFVPFEDTSGHGTSIAGIIAAKDNGVGITGINPNVEIYSARILDDNNQAPLSRVIESIYWAIDKKVNIISISFGTSQNTEVLHKAIKDAYNAGILIVASAGNNGGTVEYPAAYDEVMAVGAVDASGALSDTSSRGKQVDIVAPGEFIKTTGSFGGELITSGTSISVPHVVGVASLLWEKDIDRSNDFIRALLVASSNKSTADATENKGIVDLEYALSIYDEFKDNYAVDMDVESVIEENTREISTEDSEVVNARWKLDGHVTLAGEAGKTHNLSSAKIKILKLGIKYPDEQFPSRKTNPQWHTCDVPQVQTDNYISSYRCATLIARAIKKGKKVNKDNIARPKGMKTANYNNMISQVQGISWSSALGGADVTANNKALFTIGMAMHIVTDTYAHQSYRKVNGEWKPIEHADDCDNKDVVKKRVTLAQSAACDVLQAYLVGDTGDHWEYVQDYDGTSFRLHKLVQYTKNQDTYNSETFGEMATLKKGSIKDE